MAASRKRTHGAGTITRRPNGRHTAQLTDPRTGRRRSLGTFDTRREAERAIARATLSPGPGAAENLTLGEYVTEWAEDRASYVGPVTADRYRKDARRYVLAHPIAEIRLGRLRPADFRRLFADLRRRGGAGGRPLGDWTVHGVDRMLWAAIGTAVTDRALRDNPMPAERVKITRRERPWAGTRQIGRLLQMVRLVDPELEVAVRLGALYGFRRGEVAGLTWSDVGADRVRIHASRIIADGRAITSQPKTAGSAATVLIDADTAAALAEMRERRAAFIEQKVPPAEHVYVTTTGEPLYPDTITERFARVVEAFNVTHAEDPLADGFTFHSLRHSFASILIARGVSTMVIAAAGRWRSAALVEKTYGHLAPSTVADAVAQHAAAIADAVMAESPDAGRTRAARVPSPRAENLARPGEADR